MRILIAILCLFIIPLQSSAQVFTDGHTRWDDDLTTWDVFTDDEDFVLEIAVRWNTNQTYQTWDFQCEDYRGEIRRKWNDDPNQWEMRVDGKLITARTIWKDDLTEWRVQSSDQKFTLVSKYRNQFDEWFIKEDDQGQYYMYTEWESDPRDWIIEETMDESISSELKLMLFFIASYHAIPE